MVLKILYGLAGSMVSVQRRIIPVGFLVNVPPSIIGQFKRFCKDNGSPVVDHDKRCDLTGNTTAFIIVPHIVGIQTSRDRIPLNADTGEQRRFVADGDFLIALGHCIKSHRKASLKCNQKCTKFFSVIVHFLRRQRSQIPFTISSCNETGAGKIIRSIPEQTVGRQVQQPTFIIADQSDFGTGIGQRNAFDQPTNKVLHGFKGVVQFDFLWQFHRQERKDFDFCFFHFRISLCYVQSGGFIAVSAHSLMGGCKFCRLHDGAIFQLDPLDGLVAPGADAGHRRLFLLRGSRFRFRLLLRFSLLLRCSIFRQILSGINVQAKAKHRKVLYQTAHDGLVYIKHGSGFYSAFFHADFLTAARLLVIFPFRGGVGVRHSFHGFICTIQYRQPHLMRNALDGNGCIDHESGDRIIDIGQTVELFDLIAGRRI